MLNYWQCGRGKSNLIISVTHVGLVKPINHRPTTVPGYGKNSIVSNTDTSNLSLAVVPFKHAVRLQLVSVASAPLGGDIKTKLKIGTRERDVTRTVAARRSSALTRALPPWPLVYSEFRLPFGSSCTNTPQLIFTSGDPMAHSTHSCFGFPLKAIGAVSPWWYPMIIWWGFGISIEGGISCTLVKNPLWRKNVRQIRFHYSFHEKHFGNRPVEIDYSSVWPRFDFGFRRFSIKV